MNQNRIEKQFKAIGYECNELGHTGIYKIRNKDKSKIINVYMDSGIVELCETLDFYEFYIIADKLRLIEEDYFNRFKDE